MYSEQTIKEAIELRRKGIYTWREIATKLNVSRLSLIDDVESYERTQLKQGYLDRTSKHE